MAELAYLKGRSAVGTAAERAAAAAFTVAGPAEASRWTWGGRLTLHTAIGPGIVPPHPDEAPFVPEAQCPADARWTLRIRAIGKTESRRLIRSLSSLDLRAGVRVGRGRLFGETRDGSPPLLVFSDDVRTDALLLHCAPELHRLATLRLIRCAFAEAARRTSVHLHGSASVSEGGTTMICGPSGAGKTTLLLAALARGHQLLANDDCFCFQDGTLLGLPVAIGIRSDTVLTVPELRRLTCCPATRLHRPFEPSSSSRRTLSARDVTDLFGVRIATSGVLTTLCFLRPTPGRSTLELRKIRPEDVQSKLARDRHPIVSAHQRWWRSGVAGVPGADTFRRVRCLEATVGVESLPQLADVIF